MIFHPMLVVAVLMGAPHGPAVVQASAVHGVDPFVLRALLVEESGPRLDRVFNPRSHAVGVGQHTRTGRRAVNEIRCLKLVGRPRCELGTREYTLEAALVPALSIEATAEHLAALQRRWGAVAGIGWYNGSRGRKHFAARVLRRADHLRARLMPPLVHVHRQRRPLPNNS
jgi:hypothetical protein